MEDIFIITDIDIGMIRYKGSIILAKIKKLVFYWIALSYYKLSMVIIDLFKDA